MANTYTLIASNTLGASAASVTFSAIPATFTDLVLKMSMRSDRASWLEYFQFSSNLAAGYSSTYLQGTGATASSSRESSVSKMFGTSGAIDGGNATSSTFSNTELYIPSYTAGQSKVFSLFTVLENNDASNWRIVTSAGLKSSITAIDSITLNPTYGPNFVSGSSFFLYGIKNS